MAGRSAQGRRASQDVGLLPVVRTPERGRRSHSIGDDTPRPTGLLHGASSGTNASTLSAESGSPPNTHSLADHLPTKGKLGFFGEKLLSSNSGSSNSTLRPSPIAPQLLPTRSQSRADSLNAVSREATASPVPGVSASSNQPNKGHASPSKPSGTRTYDSKLISREMHRLGNLAHLPSLNPSLSSASTTTLNLPPTTSNIASLSTTDNPWTTLHVYVLPLFNGEPLRVPIEDLNALVKRHIQTVVSASPSKAISVLEHDASELINAGMLNVTSKLSGIDDDKLVNRVVELWGFFWDQVLPYVEGALLPLQTDTILSSLYRTIAKGHKPTSPVAQNVKGSMSGVLHQSTPQIDVRTIALQSFRDRIILPAFPVLNARLLAQREYPESPSYQQPRLQQMLLVLVSQRSLPSALSLTEPTPPPTAGEAAIQHLLRAIRTPMTHGSSNIRHRYSRGAPSFLSAGAPRDRRGRIDLKNHIRSSRGEDEGDDGGDTPRFHGFVETGREQGREFLESLRSPDLETPNPGMGGWGLGIGNEDKKVDDEPEEEDNMDWDQAQAVVERMVGMKGDSSQLSDARRR
ncbi:unnamed protein product [Somion occarium]|uniref:HbrB-domain-containing protein n=1 Tax=Somion occarium TaxID=3059160 RepID=A0ABP1DLX2_9APHY